MSALDFGRGAALLFCWLFVGLIVSVAVDARPRFSGVFDRLRPAGELLLIAAWPIGIPVLCWRWQRRRTR